MISVSEAKSIIHKQIPLKGAETVLLKDAGNRVTQVRMAHLEILAVEMAVEVGQE